MPELAYVNGVCLPIEEAVVPVEDRGYQFADAVYEGIASYNGSLFLLEAHLDRLESSMRALDYPPISRNKIREAIVELFERSGLARAFVYLQISRGVASRNHAFADALTPQLVITVREVREVSPELRQNGAAAITVEDYRWGRCDIKTVQLLPNVMAKQKAIANGAHDAIFVSENGVVREATSSNVFVVKNQKLITHPLTVNILPGITRAVVLACAAEIQLEATEGFYDLRELYSADEVFLTGTTTEVLPVVKIDEKKIADGKVGPVSKCLFEAIRKKSTDAQLSRETVA